MERKIININQVKQFCLFLVNCLRHDKITYVAATLTFTTLLSLVPLLSVGFSIIGGMQGFGEIESQIKSFIFTNLIPTSADVIQHNLDQFIAQTGKLSLVGSVVLLVTAIITIATVERAFNDIWGVKKPRRGISAFMLYWAVLTLGPICLGVSLGFSSYLVSLSLVTDVTASIGGQKMLLALSSFLLEVIALTLLYIAVPNCQVKYRWGIVGGIVVATIFELTKKLFALYITNFTSYEVLYGALATIPVVLLWIYLTWIIILFGAELVYALENRSHYSRGGRHPFVVAYGCLGQIHHAHLHGDSISMLSLQQKLTHDNTSDIEGALASLMACGLIFKVESGEYILGRELTDYSVYALYQQLPWKLPEEKVDEYPHLAQIVAEGKHQLSQSLDSSLSACFKHDLS